MNSALGSSGVTVARPNSSDTGHGPLSSGFQLTATNSRPMYGMSAVFTIVELSDATLSGLDLAGTAGGETITLIPVFDEDTLTYTATVAYETDAVTLTAAKNNRNATLAITGDDDTSTKNEADLDLSVGANTLTVTVTAEDTIATETYTITVTRAIAPPPDTETVPHTWSLVPTGLSGDDEFQLLFLSSTKRDARSANIDNYDTFIQDLAADGHTDIKAYSHGFRAVGCTADTDARDNTATTFTSSDKGVPIYWLDGNKVANQYQDFYDGSWDDEANDKNEFGNDAHDTSQTANYPWTGCNPDGTEAFISSTSYALGEPSVIAGQPNSSTSGNGPINSSISRDNSNTQPMYGLSQVFRVDTPTYVSNLKQSQQTTVSAFSKRSQTFTTGPNTSYVISRVDLASGGTTGTVSVDIHETNPDGTPSETIKHSLTAPPSLNGSPLRFAAPTSATLDGNTTYAIVVTPSANFSFLTTTSNDEDTAEPGWSIRNTHHFETPDPMTGLMVWAIRHGNTSLKIAVKGTVPTPPDAPTNLRATANGTNQIDLSWDTPDDIGGAFITGYNIEFSDDAGNNWSDLVANTGNTETEYSNTGLSSGTTRYYRVLAINSAGTSDASNPVNATVANPTDIPPTWSLIPSGLGEGAVFRLIFLSSTKHDASATDIATYNTFVQNSADAGHDDIQDYSAGFRAVGCTAAKDARDNTATTFTSSDQGVPIYWLNGTKVADHYQDFYNGNWDDEANDKNELATNGPNTSQVSNYPFTGCSHNGTGDTANTLGAAGAVRVGRPNSSASDHGPISNSSDTAGSSDTRPFYGLSEVFKVDTATYVSNLKQSQQTTVSAFSRRSQTFTTGPNTSYIISHVDLASGGTTGTVSVDIHETNPDGTPSETIKHSLTAPPSLNGSPLRFAAPTSATLDGNTTYAIVVTPSSANFSFLTTTSNDEDTAEPGWSIRNTHHFETPDPMTGLMVWAIRHGNTSLKIAVKGTTPAAPDAPTNLRATANGTNQIDLSWDTPGESGGATITGYKIEFSDDGNTNWNSLVANTGNANTTYSDTGLSPSTTRYYRTLAINSAGTGPASNVANATTDASAEGTVTFGPGSFTASENGATARVTVEISVAAEVTIPIRVQHRNGASSADYTGVPRRLIFANGTTIRSFTVTAVDDSDNDDNEKIRIHLGDLPAGFEAGARSAITVKLKDNDEGNSLPLFDPANELRNLVENTAPNQNVGLPITATDADGDSLTYTMEGQDKDRFTFVPATAQIQTKPGQTYDYETHELFVVDVIANDGQGGTKTAHVVIRVRDTDEPPQAPTGLTLVQAYPTSMALSWTEPDNSGRPPITGYDLQYRKSTESTWTAGLQGVTTTSDSITGLDPSTAYHVQVRANNDEGKGAWSSTLSRSTPSSSPGISITRTNLTVTEGDQTGVTYLIVLGSQPTADVHVYFSGYDGTTVAPHSRSKTFNTLTWNVPRQVLLRTIEDADATDETVTINHRVESDDADYHGITVSGLTVNVIDNDTPQVTGVWTQPGDRQLTVNWTATDKATGYKVQWQAPGDNYNTNARMATITSGSTTTYTIPNLTNGTEYTVRVTATWTGHTDGQESEEATGTPTATP